MGLLDISLDVLQELLDDFYNHHSNALGQDKAWVKHQKNAWCYYKLVSELEDFLEKCDFFDHIIFCYDEMENLSSGARTDCLLAIQVKRDVLAQMGVSTSFPTLDLYIQSHHNHKTVGVVLDNDFFNHAQRHSSDKDVFKQLQAKTQAVKNFVDGLDGEVKDLYHGTKPPRSTYTHTKGAVLGLDDFLTNKEEFLCFVEKKMLHEELHDEIFERKSFKKIM